MSNDMDQELLAPQTAEDAMADESNGPAAPLSPAGDASGPDGPSPLDHSPAKRGRGRGRGGAKTRGKNTKAGPKRQAVGRGRRQKIYDHPSLQARYERSQEIKASYNALAKLLIAPSQHLATKEIRRLKKSEDAHKTTPEYQEVTDFLDARRDDEQKKAAARQLFNDQLSEEMLRRNIEIAETMAETKLAEAQEDFYDAQLRRLDILEYLWTNNLPVDLPDASYEYKSVSQAQADSQLTHVLMRDGNKVPYDPRSLSEIIFKDYQLPPLKRKANGEPEGSLTPKRRALVPADDDTLQGPRHGGGLLSGSTDLEKQQEAADGADDEGDQVYEGKELPIHRNASAPDEYGVRVITSRRAENPNNRIMVPSPITWDEDEIGFRDTSNNPQRGATRGTRGKYLTKPNSDAMYFDRRGADWLATATANGGGLDESLVNKHKLHPTMGFFLPGSVNDSEPAEPHASGEKAVILVAPNGDTIQASRTTTGVRLDSYAAEAERKASLQKALAAFCQEEDIPDEDIQPTEAEREEHRRTTLLQHNIDPHEQDRIDEKKRKEAARRDELVKAAEEAAFASNLTNLLEAASTADAEEALAKARRRRPTTTSRPYDAIRDVFTDSQSESAPEPAPEPSYFPQLPADTTGLSQLADLALGMPQQVVFDQDQPPSLFQQQLAHGQESSSSQPHAPTRRTSARQSARRRAQSPVEQAPQPMQQLAPAAQVPASSVQQPAAPSVQQGVHPAQHAYPPLPQPGAPIHQPAPVRQPSAAYESTLDPRLFSDAYEQPAQHAAPLEPGMQPSERIVRGSGYAAAEESPRPGEYQPYGQYPPPDYAQYHDQSHPPPPPPLGPYPPHSGEYPPPGAFVQQNEYRRRSFSHPGQSSYPPPPGSALGEYHDAPPHPPLPPVANQEQRQTDQRIPFTHPGQGHSVPLPLPSLRPVQLRNILNDDQQSGPPSSGHPPPYSHADQGHPGGPYAQQAPPLPGPPAPYYNAYQQPPPPPPEHHSMPPMVAQHQPSAQPHGQSGPPPPPPPHQPPPPLLLQTQHIPPQNYHHYPQAPPQHPPHQQIAPYHASPPSYPGTPATNNVMSPGSSGPPGPVFLHYMGPQPSSGPLPQQSQQQAHQQQQPPPLAMSQSPIQSGPTRSVSPGNGPTGPSSSGRGSRTGSFSGVGAPISTGATTPGGSMAPNLALSPVSASAASAAQQSQFRVLAPAPLPPHKQASFNAHRELKTIQWNYKDNIKDSPQAPPSGKITHIRGWTNHGPHKPEKTQKPVELIVSLVAAREAAMATAAATQAPGAAGPGAPFTPTVSAASAAPPAAATPGGGVGAEMDDTA